MLNFGQGVLLPSLSAMLCFTQTLCLVKTTMLWQAPTWELHRYEFVAVKATATKYQEPIIGHGLVNIA